jgi:hypothetical protein
MVMEIIIATISGNHKMSMINVPQVNKRPKIILKSNRKAEIGTRERIIPSTITKAKK